MALAATEDHVGGSWSVLPQEAIWMSTVWITTKGHVDAHGLCCYLKSGWCPWPVLPLEAMSMSMACTVAKGHNGACGLCCGQELFWCLLSELLPETMLRFMSHANGCWRSCGCLWSLCYHQKPCRSSWSMLPLTVNVKEVFFQWYLLSQTHTWEWETLLWHSLSPYSHLPPQKETVETGSHWRELLISFYGDGFCG